MCCKITVQWYVYHRETLVWLRGTHVTEKGIVVIQMLCLLDDFYHQREGDQMVLPPLISSFTSDLLKVHSVLKWFYTAQNSQKTLNVFAFYLHPSVTVDIAGPIL